MYYKQLYLGSLEKWLRIFFNTVLVVIYLNASHKMNVEGADSLQMLF